MSKKRLSAADALYDMMEAGELDLPSNSEDRPMRTRLNKFDESKHPRDRKGEFTSSPAGPEDANVPMGTMRDGRRLEWGPDGKRWVPRSPKDFGSGPKQSPSHSKSATVIFLKGNPQYGRIAKKTPHSDVINSILHGAQDAVRPLLDAMSKLKPAEQKAVARALVKAVKPHLSIVSKAGPPDEPRDNTGKWTVGGAVGAGARLAGRGAAAVGGLTYRALRDALSTVTLVPSSKSSMSAALKEWWGRASSRNENIASEARIEAMGRVLGTVFVGIGIYAVAQYYLPIAANALGMSVSRMIGHALNLGVP